MPTEAQLTLEAAHVNCHVMQAATLSLAYWQTSRVMLGRYRPVTPVVL